MQLAQYIEGIYNQINLHRRQVGLRLMLERTLHKRGREQIKCERQQHHRGESEMDCEQGSCHRS